MAILSNRYKENWDETAERFERWWQREPTDRPLMCITAPREKPLGATPCPQTPPLPGQWLDAGFLTQFQRHKLETTYFGAEAFPLVNATLGPGSLALYLGSEPGFSPDTVWFEPCIQSLETTPLPEFNPKNRWFKTNLELIRAVHDAFAEDAFTTIPDIVESLDILSAMYGPSNTLYALMDQPEQCHRWLKRINELYQAHYDAFYDIVKAADGSSVFTAFRLWGRGKTCKVQCDCSAMLSTATFNEFFVPYLREQMKGLDRVLYHLDGPGEIAHVDALLGLPDLQAIQWISGAGRPAGGDVCWYPLYEKILSGGKGLQVAIAPGKVEDFIRRFGGRGVYLITSAKSEREADDLVKVASGLCRPGKSK